jgi:PAS domain S-box-containing protein
MNDKTKTQPVENGLEHTEEGHSQQLLLALSQSAQMVQQARTPEEVYRTVGNEVVKLGYQAVIFTPTADGTHLIIPHLTLEPRLLRAAEKLTDASAATYRVPLEPGGFYDRLMQEKRTAFLENIHEPLAETLPQATRPLTGQILKLLGLKQAIYAPLIIGEEAQGILQVIGTGLTEADIPAVTIFANQTAVALENARLYKALSWERHLMQVLMDNIPDYIYFKDKESRFIKNSRSHAALFGMSDPAQLVGKSDFDFFLAEHAQEAYEDEQRIIRTGQPIVDKEEKGPLPDGHKKWYLTTKMPLRDEAGNIIGTFGLTKEITELKETETELERLLANVQRSERLLRTITDATPDWIFIKDRQHRYVMVNQSYANALHMAPDDFIGKDDLEIGFPEKLVKGDPEEGIKGFWTDDRQVMDSGESMVIPYDLATVDDELRIFHTVKTPLRDTEGEVWGVLGFARDVTEREHLLADLERRSSQLQTAAEVSHAASSTLNLDELIQQVVDLARDRFDLYYAGLFLVDAAASESEPAWAVLQAGTGKAGQKMLRQGHKLQIGGTSMVGWCVANKQARIALDVGEEAVRFDNPLLPKTRSELALPLVSRDEVIGALTIQSTQEAAFSNEDIAVLQTMADQMANAIVNARLYEQAQQEIGERKQAEEALARQAQALDAELEQFFYVASHHLQEPLRMVVSYVQLLEQRYKDQLGDEADEFISYAITGATRIRMLINDVLAFSRVTTRARPFAPTDVSGTLSRMLNNLKKALQEIGATVTLDDMPTVLADGEQLRQVFQHLLLNAIQFRSERPLEIHIGAEHAKDAWVFSVRDNGIGIEPQYFDRIFLIFQRLHRAEEYSGTGIGLAVCKKIVERHGGRIWVESEPDVGSTFYFTISEREKNA